MLLPRLGPKPLVTLGMLLAAGGMVWLTRIGPHSGYVAAVLGPLLMAGLGFGFTTAPAMNTGTYGVAPQDAGVASATLNTGQQIGGSIGTSLLNTLAASATASYLTAHITRGALAAWPPGPAAGGPGPGARLHHRVLVVSGDLRGRGRDLRGAAAPGPAGAVRVAAGRRRRHSGGCPGGGHAAMRPPGKARYAGQGGDGAARSGIRQAAAAADMIWAASRRPDWPLTSRPPRKLRTMPSTPGSPSSPP